ncbi:MAG TPA: UDP-N-acetylmuramate dehydrogenase [Acidobacteriaceae bacterium]|nr:UDP-N-acetylmuramate dehydrogenase [Acidobacteriaceae bacterium]
MEIQENIPLAPYTTLQVGGPARFFIETSSDTEILEAHRFAREQRLGFFVLGGGSNLLVSDEGFPGVVVHLSGGCVASAEEAPGNLRIIADAGVEWDAVVRMAARRNAAGIECLSGIPGSVGGTPVQNVGAYGQEVSSTISKVHAVDLSAEQVLDMSNEDCWFSYRKSVFNGRRKGRYAITSVEYVLRLDDAPNLAYTDVKQYFAERGTSRPGLAETADAVRIIRARKGMVLAPDDLDTRSAGSFFKNPVVPVEILAALARIANCPVDKVPQYPAGAGYDRTMVKTSAAWLMELAGFKKGFASGRAALSTKHVLAITNRGGATASEIIALRDTVVAGVLECTGVRLEQEPVLLGFE